ncbi:MAG: hypothetical protein SGARI_001946 [Bacillariaceae sp.]
MSAVASRKSRDFMAHSVSSTPPEHNVWGPPTPQSKSSPHHQAMLSALLKTPSPQKRSKISPGNDGFRLLFHAAEAVEHSPMLLANLTTPKPKIGAEAEPSPITSMVNMDATTFRHAMDALHEDS